MRVAVLSDIHANLAALEAVLADARKLEVERLVLLGDYVGYYYNPDAVIERLQEWPHDAIRGNHDRLFLESRTDTEARDIYRTKYGTSIDLAFERLSKPAVEWLEALPERKTVTLGTFLIELAHGAPFDPDFYVYPDAHEPTFARCAVENRMAVWMGHTHHPFLRLGTPWLLNPGSVGQPRDIGGLASWCVFDTETGSVAFRRTEFDVTALEREAFRRDPDLVRNRDVLRRHRLQVPG